MNNKDLSFEMAKRLKALRESKGLSHDKLGAELYEKYKQCNDSKPESKRKKRKSKYSNENKEVLISRDSLINYEVSDEWHEKAYTNGGMNVEYLRYLADFYGVSSDYIIGLSDIASPNPAIGVLHEQTGLPEDTIVNLIKKTKMPIINGFITSLLNASDDILFALANRYFYYTLVKHSCKIGMESNSEAIAGRPIFDNSTQISVNGEKFANVPVDKLDNYAKFELWSAFNDFLEQEE